MHDDTVCVCVCRSEENLPPLQCERLTHFLLCLCPLFRISGGAGAQKYCTWRLNSEQPMSIDILILLQCTVACLLFSLNNHWSVQSSSSYLPAVTVSDDRLLKYRTLDRFSTHELTNPSVRSS